MHVLLGLEYKSRFFPKNCDQANFCMDITLWIPNRSWWDYEGHFQISLERVTINIIMIDKEMTELWHLEVCRVSYSSVSCIRDQRVHKKLSLWHKNTCTEHFLHIITGNLNMIWPQYLNGPQYATHNLTYGGKYENWHNPKACMKGESNRRKMLS